MTPTIYVLLRKWIILWLYPRRENTWIYVLGPQLSFPSSFLLWSNLPEISKANSQGQRWVWETGSFKETSLRKIIQKYLTFTIFFFKRVVMWKYCPSMRDPWSLNFIGFMASPFLQVPHCNKRPPILGILQFATRVLLNTGNIGNNYTGASEE